MRGLHRPIKLSSNKFFSRYSIVKSPRKCQSVRTTPFESFSVEYRLLFRRNSFSNIHFLVLTTDQKLVQIIMREFPFWEGRWHSSWGPTVNYHKELNTKQNIHSAVALRRNGARYSNSVSWRIYGQIWGWVTLKYSTSGPWIYILHNVVFDIINLPHG